mmetsp:Transcript_110158/g.351053  ORF Transcript_110158/g.351053 Transcript_110158/m.351053 type:complete len:556 (+) Transcript_110158:597-2264(+)
MGPWGVGAGGPSSAATGSGSAGAGRVGCGGAAAGGSGPSCGTGRVGAGGGGFPSAGRVSAGGGGGGGVSARGSCDGPGVGSGGTAPAGGGGAPPTGGGNCQGGFGNVANNEAGGVLGCAGGNTGLKSMAEVCSGTGCGARNAANGPRPEAETGTAEVGTPSAGSKVGAAAAAGCGAWAAGLDVGPTIIVGATALANAEGGAFGAEVGALSGSSENGGAAAVCVAGATGLGAVGPHIDGDAATIGATAGCVAVPGSAAAAIVGAAMPTGGQGAGAEAAEPLAAGPDLHRRLRPLRRFRLPELLPPLLDCASGPGGEHRVVGPRTALGPLQGRARPIEPRRTGVPELLRQRLALEIALVDVRLQGGPHRRQFGPRRLPSLCGHAALGGAVGRAPGRRRRLVRGSLHPGGRRGRLRGGAARRAVQREGRARGSPDIGGGPVAHQVCQAHGRRRRGSGGRPPADAVAGPHGLGVERLIFCVAWVPLCQLAAAPQGRSPCGCFLSCTCHSACCCSGTRGSCGGEGTCLPEPVPPRRGTRRHEAVVPTILSNMLVHSRTRL